MRRLTMCVSLLVVAGCGRGSGVPYTDHSRDPERFAANVKQMVYGAVAEARTSREPADSLSGIVDTFEGRLGRLPVGQYRSIYEQLLSQASELYEACEAIDGRPPDLEPRLKELWAVAEQLPGEVPTWQPPRD